MKLFQLLGATGGPVIPENCKVHLAVHNGAQNPRDVYLQGNFDAWQNWQSKRNFSREYVVSLVRYSGADKWLFVGCYRKDAPAVPNPSEGVTYDLRRLQEYQELEGRLVVSYGKDFRQTYPYGETIVEAQVDQILEKRLSVSQFNGFKNVRLPFNHLKTIVLSQESSWRAALSSVAGVYVISDPDAGKLYVGSAYGQAGIWGRWSSYTDGHGNNKMLKEIVAAEGIKRAEHFWFSILETIDVDTAAEDVIARENFWKDVLLSRQTGYNASEGGKATS